MKTNEMNAEERLALGSLVRIMVRLDGEYSREESDELSEIAQKLGEDDFWAAVDDAGKLDLDEEAVMERARAVERVDARETIYAALAEIAEAGAIVGSESTLLDWLISEWNLSPGNAARQS